MKRKVVALAILAAAGCLPWYGPEKTLDEYVLAIQERRFRDCFRLMAPGLRESVAGLGGDPYPTFEGFSKSMELLHEKFELDRKKGKLNFSPDGVALIRALGLGKGAFYQVDRSASRFTGLEAVLLVRVVLPYNLLDRPDQARPGKVFWRLRRPFGEVYPLLFGLPFSGSREELHSIQVRVDLTGCGEAPDSSPTGWCVLAVTPLPETAEYHAVEAPSP